MTARRLLALLLAFTLSAAFVSPALAADAAPAKAAPAKTRKKKKKAYDYDQSKYKAYKELVADDSHSYRFDEYGNPIPVGGKKKVSKKKKKEEAEEPQACGAGEACQDDGTGSDAKASVESGD